MLTCWKKKTGVWGQSAHVVHRSTSLCPQVCITHGFWLDVHVTSCTLDTSWYVVQSLGMNAHGKQVHLLAPQWDRERALAYHLLGVLYLAAVQKKGHRWALALVPGLPYQCDLNHHCSIKMRHKSNKPSGWRTQTSQHFLLQQARWWLHKRKLKNRELHPESSWAESAGHSLLLRPFPALGWGSLLHSGGSRC